MTSDRDTADIMLTSEQHMEIAGERIRAARNSLDNGFYRDACSSAYYAVFAATCGVLVARGVSIPKTHKGVNVQFHEHVVKTGLIDPDMGRSLSVIERTRLVADYSGKPVNSSDAQGAVDLAEEFVKNLLTFSQSTRTSKHQ